MSNAIYALRVVNQVAGEAGVSRPVAVMRGHSFAGTGYEDLRCWTLISMERCECCGEQALAANGGNQLVLTLPLTVQDFEAAGMKVLTELPEELFWDDNFEGACCGPCCAKNQVD